MIRVHIQGNCLADSRTSQSLYGDVPGHEIPAGDLDGIVAISAQRIAVRSQIRRLVVISQDGAIWILALDGHIGTVDKKLLPIGPMLDENHPPLGVPLRNRSYSLPNGPEVTMPISRNDDRGDPLFVGWKDQDPGHGFDVCAGNSPLHIEAIDILAGVARRLDLIPINRQNPSASVIEGGLDRDGHYQLARGGFDNAVVDRSYRCLGNMN